MNWEKLFTMQQALDQYINTNHNLEDEELFKEKVLALLVELGELANETRCFKFWSNKKSSERAVVLEEYVDNIHFLMSIGLEKNYTFTELTVGEVSANLTKHFNEVFSRCVRFYENHTEENYLALAKGYLQLAYLLGFSETDIFSAYLEKNEVNYERQKSGY